MFLFHINISVILPPPASPKSNAKMSSGEDKKENKQTNTGDNLNARK